MEGLVSVIPEVLLLYNKNPLLVQLKENLSSSLNEIEKFIDRSPLKNQMMFRFYLNIEVDPHYFAPSYSEYQMMAESLIKITEKIKMNDKKLKHKINLKERININKFKIMHKEIISTSLQELRSSLMRERVEEAIIRDIAINYHESLGFSVCTSSKFKPLEATEKSFRELVDTLYSIKSLNQDNIVIFTIECIVNFPENDELISNELNKIRRVKQAFMCTSCYKESFNFYSSTIMPKTQLYLFNIVFCLLENRVKRIFNSELSGKGNLNLEVSKSKLKLIKIKNIEAHLIQLVEILELPLNDAIKNFMNKLDQYFHSLTKLIIVLVEDRYYESAMNLELFFERSHTINRKNINFETISGMAALVGGLTVRTASAFWAGFEATGLVLSWGAFVAEFGLGITVAASAVTGAVVAVPLIGGNFFYKWGIKKYKIHKGLLGEFADNFTVGQEIDSKYKINSFGHHEIIKNCEYIDNFPKVHNTSKSCSKEMKVQVIDKNSLSAFVLNYYTINVALPKGINKIDRELIKSQIEEIAREVYRQ